MNRRSLALTVGLFLFAVYLFVYRGGFHSVDEVSIFAVTESLVKLGQPTTDQILWTQYTTSQAEAQGFFGEGGHVYSKKGLGLSLAQMPLYWLALYLPGVGMLHMVSLLNAGITALTGALVLMFVCRLGYSPVTATVTALAYGLTTIAAVYAKYLFSEPLAGLALLFTAYMLFVYRQEGGLRHVLLAGLAAGFAVMVRANNLFLVPLFGLYLLWVVKTHIDSPLSSWLKAKYLSRWLLPLALFTVSVAVSGVILLYYNNLRSGDPFHTGYDLTLFSSNVVLGFYKLLFSPLRGFFVYSPILLLSLPGWWLLRRRYPAEGWLLAACVGVTVGLFSAWSSGEGLSWGSRFMVPLVPFFALALAPVIDGVARNLTGIQNLSALSLGIISLTVFSFAIQLLAVTINPWVYLSRLQQEFGGQFFLERTNALYDFRYSQIWGQLQMWQVANSDLIWWQPWGFDGMAFGLSLLLVIWVGAAVRFNSELIGSQKLSGLQRLAIHPFSLALVTLGLSYALLVRYHHTDLQFGGPNEPYQQALSTAVAETGTTIPLLTVAQYHYHVPMNRFKTSLPMYGFAQQRGQIPPTMGRILRQESERESLWLVTVGFPPASLDNATEYWLAFNGYKASEQWFEEVRLVRYVTEQPTTLRALHLDFDGELRLLEAIWTPNRQAGQFVPVKLLWRPLVTPPANYNLFLQLLNGQGTVVAQHDNPPNGGYSPTSDWFIGQKMVMRHALHLPDDLPSGRYQLIAGLYDPATGQRLLAETGADFVEIGGVTVAE